MAGRWLTRVLVPVCGALLFAGNDGGGCTPAPVPEPECTVPADCEGLPHVMCVGEWQCVDGKCGFECGTTPPPKCIRSGCSGEVCSTEQVFTPCVWKDEFECLKLTDCGVLDDGTCGFDPNPDYLACLAKFRTCKSDFECGPGLVCLEGKCEPKPQEGCKSDTDCAKGQRCVFETICPDCYYADPPCLAPCKQVGVCQDIPGDECGPDMPCPPGQTCVAVEDCPPCVYEPPYCKMPCKVKYVCQGEPAGCKDDSDCPEGYYCQRSYCDGAGEAPSGGSDALWCNPEYGQCVRKPDPLECYSDADCPKGYVCLFEGPGACPPCDCDPAYSDCACPGCMPPQVGHCEPGCTDLDGDGACATEDCNDYDPSIGPYAPEVCGDWLDNNCNGLVDEDCTPKPECFSDADCQWYEVCSLDLWMDPATGVIACCPPNAKCTADIPPCGGGVCVLAPGYCWSDGDCGYGETCEGEIICPPDAYCFVADQPGKCVPAGPTCTPSKPGSHGPCKMLLGWVFDGQACVAEGGCSCEPDCHAFFQTREECEEACGVGPARCRSDADCAKGEYCDFTYSDLSACCLPGQMCIMIYPPCEGVCLPKAPACDANTDCGIGEVCVNGVCMLPPGACWYDSDCGPGMHCEGEVICPPGAFCVIADHPGKCVPDQGPGCDATTECGIGQVCVNGVCVLQPGLCWSDADCKYGETCEGEIICPPDADCLVPDQPGKCVPAASECMPVKPGSHGLCEMFMGFIFDGMKCVGESGCGCGNDCAYFFQTQAECEAACGVQQPKQCKSDEDCGEMSYCRIEVCLACVGCPCYGTCQPLCWSDDDCPKGEYCQVTKCGPGTKCIGPYQCVPYDATY